MPIERHGTRHVVNLENLPEWYPTHIQDTKFWEALGRTVATYGFLEETLGKAIFAFTATREFADDEIPAAFEKWCGQLPAMLSDSLGSLIEKYDIAVRNHSEETIGGIDELISDLREAKRLRDVICHGSWQKPDEYGRSIPFFVNRKIEIFQEPVNDQYLDQVRRHVVDLACSVISSVTYMGWQFPSSGGPGYSIV
tara:strand:+ start:970 stop:1557 length:588 start_codon:yes stop_codon:yes gene_type:complete